MVMPRRRFVSVLAVALLSMSAAPAGATPQPWEEKPFQSAQAAGKPILVDVYATW